MFCDTKVKSGPEGVLVYVTTGVGLPKFCLLTNIVAVCEDGVGDKSVIL